MPNKYSENTKKEHKYSLHGLKLFMAKYVL